MPKRKAPAPKLRLDRDVTVLKMHDHAMTGTRLYLVQAARPSRKAWAVCWLAPWQKTLPQNCEWVTFNTAQAAFEKNAAKPPPKIPSLTKDWQREAFYRWETAHLLKGSAILTEDQIKTVVARVSHDFNMAAPSIRFSNTSPDNKTLGYYQFNKHHIQMYNNRLHYVLHELSHALDFKINGNHLADHGPSFVRTAMILSARYAFQKMEAMEQSAKDMNLHVAPIHSVPVARY
jgi:hypothetical protein